MVEFDTMADAVAAGWVNARRGSIEAYRGATIRCVDITQGDSRTDPPTGSVNSRFGIVAEVSVTYGDGMCVRSQIGQDPETGHGRSVVYARSQSVRLPQETNQIGQRGSYTEMFAPDTYAAGIDGARRAIDAWLANPRTESQWRVWNRARVAALSEAARRAEDPYAAYDAWIEWCREVRYARSHHATYVANAMPPEERDAYAAVTPENVLYTMRRKRRAPDWVTLDDVRAAVEWDDTP